MLDFQPCKLPELLEESNALVYKVRLLQKKLCFCVFSYKYAKLALAEHSIFSLVQNLLNFFSSSIGGKYTQWCLSS